MLARVKHKRHRVKDLSLYAGKNFEISSTLSSTQSADGNFARTVLDQLASVKVTGEGGRLNLHSDDLTIKSGNDESQAWVRSQVGSLDSRTTIESGGDANIIGSQTKGKSVKVNAENLNIQSLQDTMKYEGKQESASAQVTVGYGASGSTGYSKSKMKADMATVNQQAGIFAGDDGYDVDVKQHTELTGGLVTSTEKAEMEGKNSFATGTLNAKNLDNHANYKGSSVGVSASVAANFDTPLGDKGQVQSSKTVKDESGNQVLASGAESLQAGVNVGYGSDSDSQSSQTKAGINTKNLTVRNEQAQIEKTGKTAEQIKAAVKTDITTETAESRSGKLENRFDKDKLQKGWIIRLKRRKSSKLSV